MTAAGYETQERRGQLRMRKVIGADMSFDMIDRNQRLFKRVS